MTDTFYNLFIEEQKRYVEKNPWDTEMALALSNPSYYSRILNREFKKTRSLFSTDEATAIKEYREFIDREEA